LDDINKTEQNYHYTTIQQNYKQVHNIEQMKLKPGLCVFYNIRPRNRSSLFYSSLDPHRAVDKYDIINGYEQN